MNVPLIFLILYSVLALIFLFFLIRNILGLLNHRLPAVVHACGIGMTFTGVLLFGFAATDRFIHYPPMMMAAGGWLFWLSGALAAGFAAKEMDLPTQDGSSNRNSIRAVLHMTLVFVLFFASPFVLVQQMVAHQPAGTAASQTSAQEESEVHTFEKFNFKFTVPSGGWVLFDMKPINPNTLIGFFKMNPPGYIQILAESGFPLKKGNEEFFIDAFYTALVSQNAAPHHLIEKTNLEIAGVFGRLYSAELAANGFNVKRYYWIGAHNGYVYQLVVFSSDDKAEWKTIKAYFDEAARGFSLIDPHHEAANETLKKDYQSPEFFYQAAAAGKAWSNWQFPDDPKFSLIDYKISKGLANVLLIYAFAFPDHPPDLDIFARAVSYLNRIDFDLVPAPNIRKIEIEGYRGYEFDHHYQGDDEEPFSGRFKILLGKKFGYFVASVQSLRFGPEETETIREGAGLFSPLPPGLPPEPAKMGLNSRRAHAVLFSNIGQEYYKAGDKDRAIQYLKQAFAFDETNLQTLGNLLDIYEKMKQYPEAIEIARPHKNRFAKDIPLRRQYAYLLVMAGEAKEAAGIYEDLLKEGDLDHETVAFYIKAMRALHKEKEGFEKIKAMASVSEGDKGGAVAAFLDEEGKSEDSLNVLKSLYEKHPMNQKIRTDYLWYLMKYERYEEVIRVAEKHNAQQGPSSDTYFYQAYANTILHRYSEARAFFFRARDLSPNDDEVLSYAQALWAIEKQKNGEPWEWGDAVISRDFKKQGDQLKVHEVVTLKGVWANFWRDDFAGADEERLRQVFRSSVNGMYGKSQLDELNITGRDLMDEPLTIDYRYTVPHAFQRLGKRLYIALPQIWEGPYLYPKLNTQFSIPIMLIMPGRIHSSVTFESDTSDPIETTLTPGGKNLEAPCLKTKVQTRLSPGKLEEELDFEMIGGGYTLEENDACQQDVSDQLNAVMPRLLV